MIIIVILLIDDEQTWVKMSDETRVANAANVGEEAT